MDRARTVVDISELSRILTTRGRGTEAYQVFLPHFRKGAVTIDLDGAEIVSASFLDGLLLRLNEGGFLATVSFKTSSPRLHSRLQRLSADRGIDIYRYSDGRIRKVEPSGSARELQGGQFTSVKPKNPIHPSLDS